MQPVVSAEAWQAEEIFLVYVQKALRPQRDETEASCRARTDDNIRIDAKSAAFCKSYSAPKRQTKSLRYHCTTVRITDYISADQTMTSS